MGVSGWATGVCTPPLRVLMDSCRSQPAAASIVAAERCVHRVSLAAPVAGALIRRRFGAYAILQGTFTDHRNGLATEYGPGLGWPEDRKTTHWLENTGTTPAVEISVDIVRQE
jgi:hypothetical protein